MGFKEWIIPQDKVFFTLLEEQANMLLQSAELLKELTNDYTNLEEKVKKMKTLEHEGDKIVHNLFHKLHSSFITPIDHEDISRLSSMYDNVLDHINSVSNWIYIFNIERPDGATKKFADIILKQVKEINSAFNKIKKLKQKEIEEIFGRVHKLEDEADDLRDEAFVNLFKEKDYTKIIIMKEIYEFFEKITDMCDDVCVIIEDIVIKNA